MKIIHLKYENNKIYFSFLPGYICSYITCAAWPERRCSTPRGEIYAADY
jgi:hypothetical protein